MTEIFYDDDADLSLVTGRRIAVLGDAAPVPITSALRYFRDEIIQHQKEGGCPFDPAASTAWADKAPLGGGYGPSGSGVSPGGTVSPRANTGMED